MKKIVCTILSIIIPVCLNAQKPTDVELWTGGNLNVKLSKMFSLDISENVRFNNSVRSYKKSFSELGLKIKFSKKISVKPSYRFILGTNNTIDHRVLFDGNYNLKKKDSPLDLSYRMRFQHQFISSKTYLRNKIKIGYNLSKLVDPFIGYEAFFRFNTKNEFRVSRWTFGLDWKINKRLGLTTYYRLQDDVFIKKPERQHIIGLMVDYKFKPKKK